MTDTTHKRQCWRSSMPNGRGFYSHMIRKAVLNRIQNSSINPMNADRWLKEQRAYSCPRCLLREDEPKNVAHMSVSERNKLIRLTTIIDCRLCGREYSFTEEYYP